MKRWFGLCAALLLMSACGFHLRGSVVMPTWFNQVFIAANDTQHTLVVILGDLLNAYHVTVVDDATAARYILVIDNDGMEQQLTSVSASTGPRQYQYIYHVQFHVQDKKGAIVLPSRRVVATRFVTINSNTILGSTHEAALLTREMQRDIGLQIINRLNHAH